MSAQSEADPLRGLYDRTAPHYDRMMRWMERWLFGGLQRDHLLREPADAVECVGFVIEELERAKLGIIERLCVHKPSRGAA